MYWFFFIFLLHFSQHFVSAEDSLIFVFRYLLDEQKEMRLNMTIWAMKWVNFVWITFYKKNCKTWEKLCIYLKWHICHRKKKDTRRGLFSVGISALKMDWPILRWMNVLVWSDQKIPSYIWYIIPVIFSTATIHDWNFLTLNPSWEEFSCINGYQMALLHPISYYYKSEPRQTFATINTPKLYNKLYPHLTPRCIQK